MTTPDSGTDVRRAIEVLANGGLVALPTETVYGLAARADSPAAVVRVFDVKGRPRNHPLIVHVATLEDALRLGRFGPAALELGRRFWPGPMTLLVERTELVSDVVTGGRSTVAIRIPDHRLALEVLRGFPRGLVAPSANRFGRVSPTTAAHVADDLDGDVDYILDGGPCSVGVESTIVDCTSSPPQILRPGALSTEECRTVIGDVESDATGPSRAPGMLASHYAPRCRLLLAETTSEAADLVHDLERTGTTVRILDGSGDVSRIARSLYDDLRRADADGIDTVVAVLPRPEGLGLAVRDRLAKAAYRPSNEGSRFSR